MAPPPKLPPPVPPKGPLAGPAKPAAEPPPLPPEDAAVPVPLPSWVAGLPDVAPSPWRRRLVVGGCVGAAAAVAIVLMLPRGSNEIPARLPSAAPTGPATKAKLPSTATPPASADAFERERTQALEHFQAGRFEDAVAGYERATAIDPTHAGSFAGLGAARARTGDLERAIAAYREAVRLQPGRSGFHAALGRVLREGGQPDAARAEYRKALALDPRNQAAERALREIEHTTPTPRRP